MTAVRGDRAQGPAGAATRSPADLGAMNDLIRFRIDHRRHHRRQRPPQQRIAARTNTRPTRRSEGRRPCRQQCSERSAWARRTDPLTTTWCRSTTGCAACTVSTTGSCTASRVGVRLSRAACCFLEGSRRGTWPCGASRSILGRLRRTSWRCWRSGDSAAGIRMREAGRRSRVEVRNCRRCGYLPAAVARRSPSEKRASRVRRWDALSRHRPGRDRQGP